MRLRVRVWCVVLALAASACGSATTRSDDSAGTMRGADLGQQAPPASSGVSHLQAQLAESTSWVRANTEPFASDGHETPANDLLLSPGAAEHRAAKAAFAEGDALALVSLDAEGSRTVWMMAKMAPGYHDAGGDWQYARFDPSGRAELQGSAADPAVADACGTCHQMGAAGTDFVFGLPKGTP